MKKLKYSIKEIEEILSEITINTQSNHKNDGNQHSKLTEEFLEWINGYNKYCIPEEVQNWKKITKETLYSQLVLKTSEYNSKTEALMDNSKDEVIDNLLGFMYAGEVMKLYDETKSWYEVKQLIDSIYSSFVFIKMSDILLQFWTYGAEFIDRFDYFRIDHNKNLKEIYDKTKQLQEKRNQLNSRLINALSNKLKEQCTRENKQFTSKEENVIKYYVLCNKLKNVIRTGWKDWKVNRERLESVAEHIYGVQMLAIAMKSEYQYDVNIQKVIMMLAIHELEEIIIGDLTQFEITKEEKQKLGHEAIFKILGYLLDKDELISLILEFDERKTKEAIFAYQCDKLECDLQSKLYDEENCVDLNDQEGNKTLENPTVQALLKQEKSWSGMWLAFGQETYNYDENFTNISNFAKENNISKYLVKNKEKIN